MIRGDLLDSERYWAVTIEAQRLFFHILLSADDFGLISLAPVFIGRRCFSERPPERRLAMLIAQLVDQDLIRRYEVDGAPYAFIPRFGQRLRQNRMKNPAPPVDIFSDDIEAKKKFNDFILNDKNPSALVRSSRPEEEAEEKRRRREVKAPAVDNSKWWNSDAEIQKTANGLGIEARPGETYADLKDRVFVELARRKQQA